MRRENPQFYLGWIAQLRANGTTDNELRKMGFKDPLPPVEAEE